MNGPKKQKGITLIALVITIIVMLILAGVSLSMTLGDNGIITKAMLAKEKHEESSAAETMYMLLAEAQSALINDTTEGKDLYKVANFLINNNQVENVAKVRINNSKKRIGITDEDANSLSKIYVILKEYDKYEFEITEGMKIASQILIDGYETIEGYGLYNPETGEFTKWDELGITVTDGEITGIADKNKLTGILLIPDSVTSIGSTAFARCTGLTSVTIPDSVTSIGSNAFANCTGLTSITISDSVTSIGDLAFFGCMSLKSITVPDSVTSIGRDAFRNVSILFYNGNAGSTTNTWGAMLRNPQYCDENFAYEDAGKNILVAYIGTDSEITIPDSVTSIGNSVFSRCTGLTSVTIPDSVTSIGSSAFAGCTGLTSITISDSVTSIGDKVFSGCRGLTSVTIPDSVTSIGNSAFASCKGLTSVTIPDSVTSIGNSAFANCTGLTSVTIPDSVTSIGSSAFAGCTGLTSITISDSVTSIGDKVFSGCRGLTSVTIPDSVTSIGSTAFASCKGLTSITIPDSVTSIGSSAFDNCTGLTSVTIPDSVTSIGGGAFYDVSHIYYNGTATGSPWGAKAIN